MRPGTLASVTTAPPRPGKRAFTGRAAILAVVLLGLLLAVAYPVQEYLRQRADIAALHAQRDAVRATVSSLQSESARWDDPAFVKQQAKQRLYFVAPGEKTFVIIGAPEQAVPATQPRAAAVPTPGAVAPSATLKITAQGTAWDTEKLVGIVGQELTLTYENKDAGIPHNIHIFKNKDATGDAVVQPEPAPGPETLTLKFGPLDAGDYYYQCDIHPGQMSGTLSVVAAGSAPAASSSPAASTTPEASAAP